MTHTPDTQRARQPKGSPTGGQYAAMDRAEADDLDLTSNNPHAVHDTIRALATQFERIAGTPTIQRTPITECIDAGKTHVNLTADNTSVGALLLPDGTVEQAVISVTVGERAKAVTFTDPADTVSSHQFARRLATQQFHLNEVFNTACAGQGNSYTLHAGQPFGKSNTPIQGTNTSTFSVVMHGRDHVATLTVDSEKGTITSATVRTPLGDITSTDPDSIHTITDALDRELHFARQLNPQDNPTTDTVTDILATSARAHLPGTPTFTHNTLIGLHNAGQVETWAADRLDRFNTFVAAHKDEITARDQQLHVIDVTDFLLRAKEDNIMSQRDVRTGRDSRYAAYLAVADAVVTAPTVSDALRHL